MKLHNRVLLCGAFFLLPFTTFGQTTPKLGNGANTKAPAELGKGVVIEQVKKNLEADKAGVQESDILLKWSRSDTQGEIKSPFDLMQIEIEQAPRGVVTLEGLRGTEKKVWMLGQGAWGMNTRPLLPEWLLSIYLDGQKLAAENKLQNATQDWRSAARQAKESQSAWLGSWFLYRAGKLLTDARQWQEADAAYEDAVKESKKVGPAIESQLLRTWAKRFEQQADWANVEKRYLQAAIEDQGTSSESLTLADTFDGLGDAIFHRGDLVESQKYYFQALEIQKKLAPDSLSLAKTLAGLGRLMQWRGDFAKAEDYLRESMAIREKLAPGSLDVAEGLNNIGSLAFARGDLGKSEEYMNRALAIREKLVPDSLDVATVLANLGLVAWRRGDLTTAEKFHQRALLIQEKLAPDSLVVSVAFNNLGLVAWKRGDLAKAEGYHQQALLIREKLAPDSLDVANTLNNLGVVARYRGDLDKAEDYYRGALTIRQKLAPGSLDVATSLNNLGVIARHRGDLDKAEEYYRGALTIRQKLAPGSLDAASTLNNLGLVARDSGDSNKAEEYSRQALTIREKLAPGSLDVAESLDMLGNVAHDRGDLEKAEEYHSRALAMQEKIAAGGLDVAESLNMLGNVARDRGDLTKAEEYYDRARAIWEKLAPERTDYAETLAALAGIKVKKKELDTAAQLLEKALNVLEGQMSQFGGEEEIRSGFRAKHLSYYQDYIDLLMQQKQSEQALQVVERSRARTLLEMLAAAHVDVRKGGNPALIERERSLEADIAAKTNLRIRLESGKATEEQVAPVNQEIQKLLAERKDVEAQIRMSSPGYAALTQPQTLSAKQIEQQLLGADTVLIEYSLGDKRSYVWAVTPELLAGYELPKRADIESAARQVYEQLTARNRTLKGETEPQRKARLTKAEAEYSEAAATLSRMVLAPVAAQLKGKRLLIVSDGALQYIPFAVLPEPEAPRSDNQSSSKGQPPLVEGHEIVNLPSASVLSVLRGERIGRKEGTKAVAVLADPVFAPNDARVNSGRMRDPESKEKILDAASSSAFWSADHLTRSVADVGLSGEGAYLPRLRSTRQEAEAIIAVTPPGEGMEALDFRASRATATSPELAQYRVVHFATHGLLDSEHPELSGLVLSLVDEKGKQQNGFLELEDIYNLNLPAELVVLSACETGLGKQIQGEGLVGLTRGFMYAGASRVMASLWKVDDVATAELMGRFYKAMEKEGMRPAAALRQAQIEMWKQKDWSSPYYWAAFQMQGEWK
ncbi:MAG TPA: tetratricopeptide repeat protein [Terriglobales bacterium]|nr:tetratricopeptide repeat protein [Terriglobales bacterium]